MFRYLLDLAVYAACGLTAAYYYYYRLNRDLLGGFWGASLIGLVGGVLISMITGFNAWFIRLVSWLMQPKFGDDLIFRVNIIAALIGAFLFLYILNKINHDKERR